MGNTIKDKDLTGMALVRRLNELSKQRNLENPDTITYNGIMAYLDEIDRIDWRKASAFEYAARYMEIERVTKEIKMTENVRQELLMQAYRSLNAKDKALEQLKIENPGKPPEKKQVVISDKTRDENKPIRRKTPSEEKAIILMNVMSNGGYPPHSKFLIAELAQVLCNEHSYCRISNQNERALLMLSSEDLTKVVKSDLSFIEGCEFCWDLPVNDRESLCKEFERIYTRNLAHTIDVCGVTNKNPTEAFFKGKNTLLNAIAQGFNVYKTNLKKQPAEDDTVPVGEENHNDFLKKEIEKLRRSAALKLFGRTAIAINLVIDSTNTLAGRGTDSTSEN